MSSPQHSLNDDLNTPLSGTNHDWHNDERIDPRIRSFFAELPFRVMADDGQFVALLDSDGLGGSDELAPTDGLDISRLSMTSSPDGNSVPVCVIQPSAYRERGQKLPCVVYYHGGGMSKYSCFLKCFQTTAKLIARQGIVVVMPDFRNSVVPSHEGAETGKYPCGQNDCVSTVRWVHANAEALGVDAKGGVVVAGESGGGNLAITAALKLKAQGDVRLVSGVYALCPYCAGAYPQAAFPSTFDNAGILMDYPTQPGRPALRSTKYGAGQAEGRRLHDARDCLAWPAYCTAEDVRGLPRVAVVVNEFDPFRDEGVAFFRQCASAGVRARCSVRAGTIHGTGTFLHLCPDVSVAEAQSIADFCRDQPSRI